MIQQERLKRIRAYLSEQEVLSVEAAVELLGASPATVRRDFAELARGNLAERTRGGIKCVSDPLHGMTPFALREVRYSQEKAAIAKHAAALIHPGDVVIVDGGTTTFHLAPFLTAQPLKLITNSLRLVAALEERGRAGPGLEVHVTGGALYPQAGLLTGPRACETIAGYHANVAFLSAGGICGDGVFNTNELVVELERAMIAHAEKVVILADHSKLSRRAMCRLCALDQIDVIVTDKWPESAAILQGFRDMNVIVEEAESE